MAAQREDVLQPVSVNLSAALQQMSLQHTAVDYPCMCQIPYVSDSSCSHCFVQM